MEETAKNKGGRPRVNPHKCSYCDYKTKKTSALKTHHLSNHATREERITGYKYYCEYCEAGYMGLIGWNKHINSNKHKLIIQKCNEQ